MKERFEMSTHIRHGPPRRLVPLRICTDIPDCSEPKESHVADHSIRDNLCSSAVSRFSFIVLCDAPNETFRFIIYFVLVDQSESGCDVLSDWFLREDVLASCKRLEYDGRLMGDGEDNDDGIDVRSGEQGGKRSIGISVVIGVDVGRGM
jgi:hypothetical protein